VAETKLLVVLGDSLACYTEDGRLPNDHEGLYPSRTAAALTRRTGSDWKAQSQVKLAWGVREIAADLINDTPMQSRLRKVLPTPARRVLVKSWIRLWSAAQGFGTSARQQTSPPEFREAWSATIRELIHLAPSVPICAVTPAGPLGNPKFVRTDDSLRQTLGAEIERAAPTLGVSLVRLEEVIAPWVGMDHVDGAHWPFELHAVAGEVFAGAIVERTTAERA
jgi:hypothetical protein